MALKLSVKIGDVTNLSDARYAAGMGVDYIGFNIDSSTENFVKPKTFKDITNWISGVGIIGEIGNQHPENSEDYPSYLIETFNANLAINISEKVFRIDARKIQISDIEELLLAQKGILFFIIELSTSQLAANSKILNQLCSSHPIYISTDFSEEILEQIVGTIKPKGIEIKGGLEEQPGFKDYDNIADVLEWLEIDETYVTLDQ